MSTGLVCGVQLYVFHQVFSKKGLKVEEHVDEALADVAAAGIPYVEMGFSLVGTDAAVAELKKLLDKHSLKLCGLYLSPGSGVFHAADDAEKTVAAALKQAQTAKRLGCPIVVTDPAPKPQQAAKTDDELKIQAKHLNRLGQGVAKLGMALGLHNHTPSGLNNAREIRHNCDHTDPKLVGLCLDTHWAYRAGTDPFDLLDKYPERIVSMHIRNSQNGIWMEDFGDGDIDHRRMAQWVKRTHFKGPLIIELAYEKDTKITRPLRENLKRSREYVREVFGV